MINIPLKLGNEEYYTLEAKSIKNYRQEEVARCSITPSVQVNLSKMKSERYYDHYGNMDIEQTIERFERAGDIFRGITRMGDMEITFEEYIKIVVETTGLPIKIVKEGQAVIYYYFKNIRDILKSQSPDGSLDIYNSNTFVRGKKEVGWIREGIDVGVILPSNNPTVHTIWMTTLAMKSQILLKPSMDEVFTPLRIIEALYEAGMHKEQIHFLPGNHELTSKILESTSKGIFFGSNDTISRYKKTYPDIKYYGPGRSKLFVDELPAEDMDKVIKHAADGVMSYGGKGCISLSGIVATKNGRELARGIAEVLSNIQIRNPLDKQAEIPAVMDPSLFEGLQRFIASMVEMGAENLSEKYYGREVGVNVDELHYLQPTVLYMDKAHPLFGMELPFPFVTVTEASKDEARKLLEDSLSVSVISEDDNYYRALLLDSSIQMLHRGYAKNVYDVDPEKPFEGYLSEYLYQYKTI